LYYVNIGLFSASALVNGALGDSHCSRYAEGYRAQVKGKKKAKTETRSEKETESARARDGSSAIDSTFAGADHPWMRANEI